VTEAHFHTWGKSPDWTDMLNISDKGNEI